MRVDRTLKSKEHQSKRYVVRASEYCAIFIGFVQIIKRDEESKDKAPEVMKGGIENKLSNGTRSFSTYTRRGAEVALTTTGPSGVEQEGHIFGLPELPLPSNAHLKHRYDPIVKQVTGLIMQHGKLSVAQRVRSSVPPSNLGRDRLEEGL